MKKVSIIGAAGTLGSSCAMSLAMNDMIHELCLIDVNNSLLDNHVMDFENAFPEKKIYRGTYEHLKESEVIIITAGVPNRNNETSRNAYLIDNIKIIREIGSQIENYAPNAVIITASNPVDLLNYYLYKTFNFKKERLIGYNLNDSFRFDWAIRKNLQLSYKGKIQTPVIGEHGESQVPVFSQVKTKEGYITFTEGQKKSIHDDIRTWFVQFNRLNVNRTTGWTTAVGMRRLIEGLLTNRTTNLLCSAVLEGEYGIEGLSIGVPVKINKDGIKSIVSWNLTETERQGFNQSAVKILNIIKENKDLFSNL